jgi:hypothetical protein
LIAGGLSVKVLLGAGFVRFGWARAAAALGYAHGVALFKAKMPKAATGVLPAAALGGSVLKLYLQYNELGLVTTPTLAGFIALVLLGLGFTSEFGA